MVLPDRDLSGRRVILNRATAFDLERHNNSHLMRVMMATLETLLEDEENQIRGMTYVIVGRGMSLSHCAVWSVSEAKRLFTVCEKNLGVRHRDINLLHLPLPMHAVLNFVKHLLSSKIRSRICSHAGDKGLWIKFAAGSNALPEEVRSTRGTLLKPTTCSFLIFFRRLAAAPPSACARWAPTGGRS